MVKRDVNLIARATPQERDAVMKACEALGLKYSQLARLLIIERASEMAEYPEKAEKIIIEQALKVRAERT